MTLVLSDDDRRLIALWTADCAARVLPLFEAKVPADTRPRDAIDAARAFAHGGRRTAQLRTVALAAHAAAREAGDPVATAAARAAANAAASAYIHALADPDQTKHIHASAIYQALACELAEGEDPGVGDEEIRWAVEHASPALREVARRFPVSSPGRTRFGTLRRQVEAGLRG